MKRREEKVKVIDRADEWDNWRQRHQDTRGQQNRRGKGNGEKEVARRRRRLKL